jgi:nucleotide-binding universal stress UspA family protein
MAQVDLLVMGTLGFGAMSGMLMGSVAQKVLHESVVPTHIARQLEPRASCRKTRK